MPCAVCHACMSRVWSAVYVFFLVDKKKTARLLQRILTMCVTPSLWTRERGPACATRASLCLVLNFCRRYYYSVWGRWINLAHEYASSKTNTASSVRSVCTKSSIFFKTQREDRSYIKYLDLGQAVFGGGKKRHATLSMNPGHGDVLKPSRFQKENTNINIVEKSHYLVFFLLLTYVA